MTESVKAYTKILNLSECCEDIFMFFCFHAPLGFLQSCRALSRWLLWNRSVTKTRGQLEGWGFDSCQGQRDPTLTLCNPSSLLSCIIILYTGIEQPEHEADHAQASSVDIHCCTILWWCGAKLSSDKFLLIPYPPSIVRVQLKCDGTRWSTGGEVKGKLANGVGSQYSSHYLGTWCIQHYHCW